jgi:hypothetical protein
VPKFESIVALIAGALDDILRQQDSRSSTAIGSLSAHSDAMLPVGPSPRSPKSPASNLEYDTNRWTRPAQLRRECNRATHEAEAATVVNKGSGAGADCSSFRKVIGRDK